MARFPEQHMIYAKAGLYEALDVLACPLGTAPQDIAIAQGALGPSLAGDQKGL